VGHSKDDKGGGYSKKGLSQRNRSCFVRSRKVGCPWKGRRRVLRKKAALSTPLIMMRAALKNACIKNCSIYLTKESTIKEGAGLRSLKRQQQGDGKYLGGGVMGGKGGSFSKKEKERPVDAATDTSELGDRGKGDHSRLRKILPWAERRQPLYLGKGHGARARGQKRQEPGPTRKGPGKSSSRSRLALKLSLKLGRRRGLSGVTRKGKDLDTKKGPSTGPPSFRLARPPGRKAIWEGPTAGKSISLLLQLDSSRRPLPAHGSS